MFDISFPELVVIGVIALLVLGPDRLPGALRTLGLWVGRISRTFSAMKAEIKREVGLDDIRQQLHDEAVTDELKGLERKLRAETNRIRIAPKSADTLQQPDPAANAAPAASGSANADPQRAYV